MEPWDLPKPSSRSSRRDHHHPSFSSSLLDQIYRSFDDSSDIHSMTSTTKNHHHHHHHHHRDDKLVSHRRSIAAAPRSTTDSSDSCGFSSSESDSFYGRSRSSSAEVRQAKPIRTTVERSPAQIHRSGVLKPNGAKQELGSFLRTKSKALKIYSDLKKVKQPISPGARLASFLNSLFTAGNAKKLKKVSTTNAANASTNAAAATAEQALSSTCSSASSFSRSCLSKTPSSSSVKSKRSVRFCPVSVILDEDSRPCGHKRLYENNETHHSRNHGRDHGMEELEIHVMEENRRVIEAAKDLLRSYQIKKKMEDTCDVINIDHDDEDEDEDDDAASYASSDLFELDNLSAIGIERYREELPVYETTHLTTNRAIANGFIL